LASALGGIDGARGTAGPQPVKSAAAGPALSAPLRSGPPPTEAASLPAGPASFDTIAGDGAAPPDTTGEVGPNHFVAMANSSGGDANLAVFTRAGGVLTRTTLGTLFATLGGMCKDHPEGFPVVLYDQLADRWILTQFAFDLSAGIGPVTECVAVSTSADPTSTYYTYAFAYSEFEDFPRLGVWPDAYFVGFTEFTSGGNAINGERLCAYDRVRMLQGLSATQVCFLVPDDSGNSISPVPADVDGVVTPPAGAAGLFANLFDVDDNPANDVLEIRRMHPDFGGSGSTLTGPTTVAVNPFNGACVGASSPACVPQPQTTAKLRPLSDRLMFRAAYHRFGDHDSLMLTHNVDVPGGTAGPRWYELRDPLGSPTVYQQSTYAPNDGHYRITGSPAMNDFGDVGLGFTRVSSTQRPTLTAAARSFGDTLSTLSNETTFITGAGSSTLITGRWGDDSQMSVDPVDGCTFWFTSEYMNTISQTDWQTRVVSFKTPACDYALLTVTPDASIALGGTQQMTAAASVSASDPTEDVTNRARWASSDDAVATVSPTGEVTGVAPGTATITARIGALAGTATITVTDSGTTTTSSTSSTTSSSTTSSTTSSTSTTSTSTSTSTTSTTVPAGVITVKTPNGGEVWHPGDEVVIRWTYANPGGSTVRIILLDRGDAVMTIDAERAIGTDGRGSKRWTIPSTIAASSRYKIKVIVNRSRPTLADTSDRVFSIGP
jgi:hypothetical protein